MTYKSTRPYDFKLLERHIDFNSLVDHIGDFVLPARNVCKGFKIILDWFPKHYNYAYENVQRKRSISMIAEELSGVVKMIAKFSPSRASELDSERFFKYRKRYDTQPSKFALLIEQHKGHN